MLLAYSHAPRQSSAADVYSYRCLFCNGDACPSLWIRVGRRLNCFVKWKVKHWPPVSLTPARGSFDGTFLSLRCSTWTATPTPTCILFARSWALPDYHKDPPGAVHGGSSPTISSHGSLRLSAECSPTPPCSPSRRSHLPRRSRAFSACQTCTRTSLPA